jgi:hypothetical protein
MAAQPWYSSYSTDSYCLSSVELTASAIRSWQGLEIEPQQLRAWAQE